MDPESIINLFNSCWFNLEILKKSSNSIDPDPEIQKIQEPTCSIMKLPSILVRSKSDEIGSMVSLYSVSPLSPSSVLCTSDHDEGNQERNIMKGENAVRRKKRLSKSLSELEFEELKGFMDLGFVFSEEDRDSSLVEIIPGLQRLGKKDEEEEEEEENGGCNEVLVSRPYLSEAWDVIEERRKREKAPLMIDWRGIDVSNEVDMKDNLKWWAHTVASAVR